MKRFIDWVFEGCDADEEWSYTKKFFAIIFAVAFPILASITF